MVSKSQIKLIRSLSQKKYRNKHGLFIAEGIKVIHELLHSSFNLHMLFSTEDYFNGLAQHIEVTDRELKAISHLSSPQKALAIFEKPIYEERSERQLMVALDRVRDPGNLGTIIRLCDWFGVTQLLCSQDTVDAFNPKVIQATMGSISRVEVHYVHLKPCLTALNLPIYGTLLDGKVVHEERLSSPAVLVMGNEANGISKDIQALLTHRIRIAPYGRNPQTESLNVATATAIFLQEFRRN